MLYRLMQMIVVLFVISTLTFIFMEKLSPGNPVDKILHLDVAQVFVDEQNNVPSINWD